MNDQDFEGFVRDGWDREGSCEPFRSLFIMATGLAGEAGEVCDILKKHVRDTPLDHNELCLELGDVLHYVTRIAQEFGLTLGEIKERNTLKLIARRKEKAHVNRKL